MLKVIVVLLLISFMGNILALLAFHFFVMKDDEDEKTERYERFIDGNGEL